jgi:hypothetical protein
MPQLFCYTHLREERSFDFRSNRSQSSSCCTQFTLSAGMCRISKRVSFDTRHKRRLIFWSRVVLAEGGIRDPDGTDPKEQDRMHTLKKLPKVSVITHCVILLGNGNPNATENRWRSGELIEVLGNADAFAEALWRRVSRTSFLPTSHPDHHTGCAIARIKKMMASLTFGGRP